VIIYHETSGNWKEIVNSDGIVVTIIKIEGCLCNVLACNVCNGYNVYNGCKYNININVYKCINIYIDK